MSKNIIAAIAVVIVIGAAIGILAFTSPGGGPEPGPGEDEEEEVVSVVIEDPGNVGYNLIRTDVRNAGNVDVRLTRIDVKDTDIEGYGIMTASLKPGDVVSVDVSLSKGVFESGNSYTLTFTIETNKGDFEQDATITVE